MLCNTPFPNQWLRTGMFWSSLRTLWIHGSELGLCGITWSHSSARMKLGPSLVWTKKASASRLESWFSPQPHRRAPWSSAQRGSLWAVRFRTWCVTPQGENRTPLENRPRTSSASRLAHFPDPGKSEDQPRFPGNGETCCLLRESGTHIQMASKLMALVGHHLLAVGHHCNLTLPPDAS